MVKYVHTFDSNECIDEAKGLQVNSVNALKESQQTKKNGR